MCCFLITTEETSYVSSGDGHSSGIGSGRSKEVSTQHFSQEPHNNQSYDTTIILSCNILMLSLILPFGAPVHTMAGMLQRIPQVCPDYHRWRALYRNNMSIYHGNINCWTGIRRRFLINHRRQPGRFLW